MRDTLSASPRESVLIDAAEFARMLSVSKPTLWRMLSAQKKIPEPIRLTSQCLRWRRDSVLAWINAGCEPVATSNNKKESEIE